MLQMKKQKIFIPNHLYWDDTPDPHAGLYIERGHVFRDAKSNLCTSPDKFVAATDEEDVENGYMFLEEDFELMKYEDPLIEDLKDAEVKTFNVCVIFLNYNVVSASNMLVYVKFFVIKSSFGLASPWLRDADDSASHSSLGTMIRRRGGEESVCRQHGTLSAG